MSFSFDPGDWYDHRRAGRGGAGGGSCPPIRAVCRHTLGQRVDIIRAKHNTCLNNTNLGSVTGVKGNISATSGTTPPPNWARKISATTPPPSLNMDPGKFMLQPPPPHRIHSGKTRSAPPPPMDVGPYAYGCGFLI